LHRGSADGIIAFADRFDPNAEGVLPYTCVAKSSSSSGRRRVRQVRASETAVPSAQVSGSGSGGFVNTIRARLS
jgi:hypothetical protein